MTNTQAWQLFEQSMDHLITANQLFRQTFDPHMKADEMSTVTYLENLGTIIVKAHRVAGRTEYIKRHAQASDAVLTALTFLYKEPIACEVVDSISKINSQHVRVLWVDQGDLLSDDALGDVYRAPWLTKSSTIVCFN